MSPYKRSLDDDSSPPSSPSLRSSGAAEPSSSPKRLRHSSSSSLISPPPTPPTPSSSLFGTLDDGDDGRQRGHGGSGALDGAGDRGDLAYWKAMALRERREKEALATHNQQLLAKLSSSNEREVRDQLKIAELEAQVFICGDKVDYAQFDSSILLDAVSAERDEAQAQVVQQTAVLLQVSDDIDVRDFFELFDYIQQGLWHLAKSHDQALGRSAGKKASTTWRHGRVFADTLKQVVKHELNGDDDALWTSVELYMRDHVLPLLDQTIVEGFRLMVDWVIRTDHAQSQQNAYITSRNESAHMANEITPAFVRTANCFASKDAAWKTTFSTLASTITFPDKHRKGVTRTVLDSDQPPRSRIVALHNVCRKVGHSGEYFTQ
ncbi:propionyl-CoA synthetase [Pseudohyphozyma bogoriensis]|nr:propionyl-CoA synthetase [Pseudohyphozyma bogoriensis]